MTTSPEPLYRRIYEALREEILAGRIAPGGLLPSEMALAAQWGVSRITAKRALNELAASGLVIRQRGRGHGSRVIAPGGSVPVLASVDDLLANSQAMGAETEVELLEFGYVPAPPRIAAALGSGAEPVQRAVRVRRMSAGPFSHATTWIPEAIGRSFGPADLAVTPISALVARAGVQVASAEQTIGAAAASGPVAAALEVPEGTALLKVERLSRGADRRPCEWIEVLYNPERYQYRMNLERIGPTGGGRWSSR